MKVQLEQVSHREQSFRVLQLELRAFQGAWHRHPQAELTWIESGQGLRFIGDDVAPFADDDLVLLGPNLPHVWLSPPEREGQPHRTTVLQFRSDLFAVNSVPEWLAVQALLGAQFGNVPRTRSDAQITLLEEEKISAYYGAGTLYATPERQEPLV